MTRFKTQFPEGAQLSGLAGLAEAAMDFRWRLAQTLGRAFGLKQEALLTLMNPVALLSGSSIVRRLRLLRATGTLSSVPEGKSLLDAARGRADLVLEPHLGARVGYNMQPGNVSKGKVVTRATIGVATETTHGMVLHILAHELQHQRQRNAGVFDPAGGKLVSPTDRIWWTRFIEADAQATAIETAWKLRKAGKPAAWDYITHCSGTLPSLAGAYLAQLRADPAAENDGRAKRAAFDTWFVTSAEGTVFYNDSAMNNQPGVEALQKARDSGTPFGRVTPQDLRLIGTLSDVNYLALPIGRTLDDPYYRKPDRTPDQSRRLAAMEAAFNAVRDGTPPGQTPVFNDAAARRGPSADNLPPSLYNAATYAPQAARAPQVPPAPQAKPGPKPPGINLGYYSPGA